MYSYAIGTVGTVSVEGGERRSGTREGGRLFFGGRRRRTQRGTLDRAEEEEELYKRQVADKAMQAYDDLMDLGMNVESRYSGRVFEVAGGMLKTSLDAKVAKLDKKLKMVELQLKKEKMDKESSNVDDGMINGEGYVVTDRNSLLERLKGLDKDK